jgi:hypothetical protein
MVVTLIIFTFVIQVWQMWLKSCLCLYSWLVCSFPHIICGALLLKHPGGCLSVTGPTGARCPSALWNPCTRGNSRPHPHPLLLSPSLFSLSSDLCGKSGSLGLTCTHSQCWCMSQAPLGSGVCGSKSPSFLPATLPVSFSPWPVPRRALDLWETELGRMMGGSALDPVSLHLWVFNPISLECHPETFPHLLSLPFLVAPMGPPGHLKSFKNEPQSC